MDEPVTRACDDREELAIKLLAAYEQIEAQERRIANLQVETANLRLENLKLERKALNERFGFHGPVSLSYTSDGQRTLTLHKIKEDKEKTS